MPLITANGKRLFFAHVPKTGGSSVEDYLVRRFGGPMGMKMAKPISAYPRSGLIVSATHLSADDLEHLLPPDLDHLFTVVREPLSRLKSQYRYQLGDARAAQLNFATWLRVMIAALRIDPRIYRNHIRPQTELVPKGARAFKLEEGFDAMISWIDEVTSSEASQVKMGHMNARPERRIEISREDAALVAKVYNVDYERFSYARPTPSDFPSRPFPSWKMPMVGVLGRALVAKQRRDWLR